MLKHSKLLAISLLLSGVFPVLAADDTRFVSKITLPSGQMIVVAEGDFEARSIGSMSVRLYDAADSPNETTFYRDGLIQPRDGVVETVLLADINSEPTPEVIVVMRAVGSGNFLSAAAFAVTDNQLTLAASVTELAAKADPVAALRQARAQRESSPDLSPEFITP